MRNANRSQWLCLTQNVAVSPFQTLFPRKKAPDLTTRGFQFFEYAGANRFARRNSNRRTARPLALSLGRFFGAAIEQPIHQRFGGGHAGGRLFFFSVDFSLHFR